MTGWFGLHCIRNAHQANSVYTICGKAYFKRTDMSISNASCLKGFTGGKVVSFARGGGVRSPSAEEGDNIAGADVYLIHVVHDLPNPWGCVSGLACASPINRLLVLLYVLSPIVVLVKYHTWVQIFQPQISLAVPLAATNCLSTCPTNCLDCCDRVSFKQG